MRVEKRPRDGTIDDAVKEISENKNDTYASMDSCISKYRWVQQMAHLIEEYQDMIADVVEEIREQWPREFREPFPWQFDREGRFLRGTSRWASRVPRQEQRPIVNFCGSVPIEKCWKELRQPFIIWSEKAAEIWSYQHECYMEDREENHPGEKATAIPDNPGKFAEKQKSEDPDNTILINGRKCLQAETQFGGNIFSRTVTERFWCPGPCEEERRASDYGHWLEAVMLNKRKPLIIPPSLRLDSKRMIRDF